MKNATLLKIWGFVAVTLLASSGWGFETDKDSLIKGNLTLSSDQNATIDSTTPSGNLRVEGSTTLGNDSSDTTTVEGPLTDKSHLSVEGNTTLGNDPSDTTTVKGKLTAESDLTVAGTLIMGEVADDGGIVTSTETISSNIDANGTGNKTIPTTEAVYDFFMNGWTLDCTGEGTSKKSSSKYILQHTVKLNRVWVKEAKIIGFSVSGESAIDHDFRAKLILDPDKRGEVKVEVYRAGRKDWENAIGFCVIIFSG